MHPDSSASVLTALRNSRVFAEVSPVPLAELAEHTVPKTLRRGEPLWFTGDKAQWLTIIVQGLVKILRVGTDGANHILGFFGPRDSVGDLALVGQRGYPADAVAETDVVQLLCVDGTSVHRSMQRYPEVAQALQRSLVDHSEILQGKIVVLTAGVVERRLATLFLHLAERFGEPLTNGGVRLSLPLSRGELSGLVGCTIETTIRTMSRWQKESLVHTSPTGFHIESVAWLRKVANGEL